MVPVPPQVDDAPVPDSAHVTGLPVFESNTGRSTIPVGVVGPVAAVSVTVAVQVMDWLVETVVESHVTIKLVACKLATVIGTEAELVA